MTEKDWARREHYAGRRIPLAEREQCEEEDRMCAAIRPFVVAQAEAVLKNYKDHEAAAVCAFFVLDGLALHRIFTAGWKAAKADVAKR